MAKISRKSYTAAQKLHVVDFAEHSGNLHPGRQFSLVRSWFVTGGGTKLSSRPWTNKNEAIEGENVFWAKLEDMVSKWNNNQKKVSDPCVKKHDSHGND